MADWWNGLTAFQQVMSSIGIATSILLIIQVVLLVIGVSGAGGAELPDGSGADFDAALNHGDIGELGSIKLFTLRGFIAFLAIGSWVTAACSGILPIWASCIIGLIAGAVTAYLMALAFKLFEKFQTNGNIDIGGTVGQRGTVYIPIPAHSVGRGKINVVIHEKLIEIDAITEGVSCPTGAIVDIVRRLDETTLVVKKSD